MCKKVDLLNIKICKIYYPMSATKFNKLCREGNLNNVKHFITNNRVENVSLVNALSKLYSLDIFKYLLTLVVMDGTKMKSTMKFLCKNNKLTRMQLMYNKFYYSYYNINVDELLFIANSNNNFEIIDWLIGLPQHIDVDILRNVSINGSIDIYKKICEKRKPNSLYIGLASNGINWKEKIEYLMSMFTPKSVIPIVIDAINSENMTYIITKYKELIEAHIDEILTKLVNSHKMINIAQNFNVDVHEYLGNTMDDNDTDIINYCNNDVNKLQKVFDKYVNNKYLVRAQSMYICCKSMNIRLNIASNDNKLFNYIMNKSSYVNMRPWLVAEVGGEIVKINNYNIPVYPSTKKRKREDDCCVCMEPCYNETNCEHNICTQCLKNMNNRSCPVCRTNITNIRSFAQRVA